MSVGGVCGPVLCCAVLWQAEFRLNDVSAEGMRGKAREGLNSVEES